MSGSASELGQFPEGTQIIPIHPLAKYAIMVPRSILPEDDKEFENVMAEMSVFITEWWEGSNPFMILTDEMTLVKVGVVDLLLDEDDDEEKA
jgi:hypothetical protein